MKLKICRVRDLGSAHELIAAGVDYLGFHDIDTANVERSQRLAVINRTLYATGFTGGVLLTKATDTAWIVRSASNGLYPFVQLHRDASLSEIKKIARLLCEVGSSLIQVVDPSIHRASYAHEVLEHAKYVLYDNYIGGTGRAVAESQLDSMPMNRAFIAGGIDDARAQRLQSRFAPYAIDVQSWVQRPNEGTAPLGYSKDMNRVTQLVRIVRRSV